MRQRGRRLGSSRVTEGERNRVKGWKGVEGYTKVRERRIGVNGKCGREEGDKRRELNREK